MEYGYEEDNGGDCYVDFDWHTEVCFKCYSWHNGDKMKRGHVVLISLILVSLLSVSFVSANWFTDLFNIGDDSDLEGELASLSGASNGGLVSYYRFDGDIKDSAGNNHGINYEARFVEGMAGDAASFDGVGSYVETPDIGNLFNKDYVSLGVWVYPASTPSSDEFIIFIGDSTPGHDVSMWISEDLSFGCRADKFNLDNIDDSEVFYSSKNTVKLNEWQHVICVFDAVNDNVKFFIDGIKVIDNKYTNIIPADYTYLTQIGRFKDGGDNDRTDYFKGIIDEVKIWDSALSDAQVLGEYESYFEPECTDSDGDGYSIEGGTCGAVDCNDGNSNVNPSMQEVCEDSIDNNCDGVVDEGCITGPPGTPGGTLKNIKTVTNVQDFGAKGNGITDDTSAIQAAIGHAFWNGGGEVYLPPTGEAYLISSHLQLHNGIILKGAGSLNSNGYPETESLTKRGTWIKVSNPSDYGVWMTGMGTGIEGINFIHKQGVDWDPSIDNNWTIKVMGTYFHIENVNIYNTARGISIEGSKQYGLGTYSYLNNIYFSAYKTGLSITEVNDNMYLDNLHFRAVINPGAKNEVEQYLLNNFIAMDIGYLDNAAINNINIFIAHTGMFFRDTSTDIAGFKGDQKHSAFNTQFNNIQFNLVRHAMRVENGLTEVWAQFNNIFAQGNVGEYGLTLSDTLFLLNSNNIDIQFSNLIVPHAGGSVMEIGNGGKPGAFVMIDNLRLKYFSTVFGVNKPAFKISDNARLVMGSNLVQIAPGHVVIDNSEGGDYLGEQIIGY